MDNHQCEIAEAMSSRGNIIYYCDCKMTTILTGYCMSTTPTNLIQLMQQNLPKLNPYPEPDYSAFPIYVDKIMSTWLLWDKSFVCGS